MHQSVITSQDGCKRIRLSIFISVQFHIHILVLTSILLHYDTLTPHPIPPKKREEILLLILGTRTNPKCVILPASEEVREREKKTAMRAEGKPPRCSRTRAKAGEVPELLKSQAKSSTGGGSDQYESGDVQETSTVNTMRTGARPSHSICFSHRTESGSLVISQNVMQRLLMLLHTTSPHPPPH